MIYLVKYKNVAIFGSKRSFLPIFYYFFTFFWSNVQSLLYILNGLSFRPSYHFIPHSSYYSRSAHLTSVEIFQKHFVKFFSYLKFLQKLSHKNAIKTANRAFIYWSSGYILAIFEKKFGHDGHDFQFHWPYFVSKSWQHCHCHANFFRQINL